MFKIPSWEDDVPKSKVDFGKTSKKKKENKLTEAVKSPEKLPNQQNDTITVKTDKKNNKKTKTNSNKNISLGQSKLNGFSKFNKQGNNSSTLKNKNKKKPKQHQQQNINTSNQQIQSPTKKIVDNTQSQSDGNRKQNSDGGPPSKNSINKRKKRKLKKRKLNSQESSSANDLQAQQNDIEDTIDISDPSKPKKKKYNDDLDPSSIVPAKKKRKSNQDEDLDTDVKLTPHLSKEDKKKEKLRKLLQVESHRNSINVNGNKLRERMMERLKAAQFRFLNEKLYTTSGSEAQKLFQSDPDAFHTYHQGYQQQLKKWPVNPLDLIVKRISKMPKTHIIADMGCGEAALSKRVQQSVRSFDLLASAPAVEACDMAHTPLLSDSVDVAVYCLALMGTELTQYLVEANRVLKLGGHLLIAEVESRFDKVETFTESVQRLGFKLKNLDKSHQVFYFMEFTKLRAPPAKKSKLPELTLKPCLYKKR
ncbi:hypothetical protein ABMA28_015997 [Loxostege sticticalis]|uniref:Ribosomal RNA-processing protein 8 n=1 Tax=Loxostege sticticalis TaxID=481309 RepID=A0ABD0T792_LOXSC